eukprot:1220059-Ditylum_brightwellii.AAC.1
MTVPNKNSIYKYKAFTFLNGSPEGVWEWEKKMCKLIKCKPVGTAEGQFDLVEALLEGDALVHWMEFKHVKTMHTSKNLDEADTVPKGICSETFKVCLQELKNITSQEFSSSPKGPPLQSCQKAK